MNAIFFYITRSILYLISLLPLRVLYFISDLTFIFLYHLLSYRKKVVMTNLRNSFPEKSARELRIICRKFYRYFCDLGVETLKTLSISPKVLKRHVLMQDTSVFKKFQQANQSAIIVMGHFGNWELGGARFAVENLQKLIIVYHPLADRRFNNLLYHMRTRLGNGLYSMKNTLRSMIRDRDQVTITTFIADQTPSHQNVRWMSFLHQDTPVFTGPEKIAKKFRYPIIYVSLKRIKRGLYDLQAEVLVAKPEDTKENEITALYTRRLERDIREQPEIWLWTHRRWKHTRPNSKTGNEVVTN